MLRHRRLSGPPSSLGRCDNAKRRCWSVRCGAMLAPNPALQKSGIFCKADLQTALMVTASDRPATFEFGRFRLVPYRRQLLADGRPVRLGGRTADDADRGLGWCGQQGPFVEPGLARPDRRGKPAAGRDFRTAQGFWPGIQTVSGRGYNRPASSASSGRASARNRFLRPPPFRPAL
jgi:hypothetical protein